ncbi:MAG: biotin/lipoyl-containing protein, partial [Pseudomonadota bacterium]
FASGDISTAFIAEEYPDGFTGVAPAPEQERALAAVALGLSLIEADRRAGISGRMRPTAPKPAPQRDWVVLIGREERALTLEAADAAAGRFEIADGAGWRAEMRLDWRPGRTLAEASFSPVGAPESGVAAMTVAVRPALEGWRLRWRGVDQRHVPMRPGLARLAAEMPVKTPPDTSKQLLCPMPGLVVRIDVAAGDKVEGGQAVAVIEAMKMENILRAERPAVVKAVNAAPGDSLAVDAVIVEFE